MLGIVRNSQKDKRLYCLHCIVLVRNTLDRFLQSSGCFLSRGWGVLPYMGYIGMCGPKGYGFLAVLVITRVSILADFCHK